MRNDRRESIERGRVGAQWRGKHKARPVSNDVISLVSQRVNNYGLSQAFQVGPQDPSLFLSCSLHLSLSSCFFYAPFARFAPLVSGGGPYWYRDCREHALPSDDDSSSTTSVSRDYFSHE